jgi:hypothetical protein
MDADIYSIALENVERLIDGRITQPSPGTLAARVLEWADKRACEKVPVVTVTLAPFSGKIEGDGP